jgi:hypothetical protein
LPEKTLTATSKKEKRRNSDQRGIPWQTPSYENKTVSTKKESEYQNEDPQKPQLISSMNNPPLLLLITEIN